MSKLLLALVALVVLAGCASTDPLTEQNLHRAWEVREEDKRIVLPDEEYNALPVDQRKFYLPKSKDDARAFERDQAYEYEKSKGGE